MNQLLGTLRFYATGCSQLETGDYGGFSKSAANRIVHRVSNAIASLAPLYIKFPQTQQEIKQTQMRFYEIAKFPRTVGALDCTHIKISSPGGDHAEYYRNRKGYFSLNVQAICNANLEFTDIVARWPGSTHDSHIFNNCFRRMRFEEEAYSNAVLVVDAGYASRSYLIPPLENPTLPEEHLFNESQIRTRNPVERLFGCWKRRFPVLAIGLRVNVQNVFPIIVATAVLHNILRQAGEEMPPDDPILHLPTPWENLIEQGEMRDHIVAGRGQDTVRTAMVHNYFKSLLPRGQ